MKTIYKIAIGVAATFILIICCSVYSADPIDELPSKCDAKFFMAKDASLPDSVKVPETVDHVLIMFGRPNCAACAIEKKRLPGLATEVGCTKAMIVAKQLPYTPNSLPSPAFKL